MNRAGATDTSAEPSTSRAKGELGRAGALPGSARDATAIASDVPEPVPRAAAAAEDGHRPPPAPPNAAPTKMGTNLYDVSWSLEEQGILEKGLRTYAEGAYEGPWRYIKIAAHLPAKGVRDVALRVRWMKRKHASEKTNAKRRKTATAATANGDGAHPDGAGAHPDGSGSIPGGGEKEGSGAREKSRRGGLVKSAGAVGRRATHSGAQGGPSHGATNGATASAGRPKSVFSMPMPGSLTAPGLGAADGNGPGGAGSRGAPRVLGGRARGAPPGYGAVGGGMETGVLPVPGVAEYAHHPPGVPPGMYPHAYPHAGMLPGMPPGMPAGAPAGGPHPAAHALRAPPAAAPVGALEPHGGVEITAGVGAIDRRLYGQLVSNAAIIARLRDDDAARDATGRSDAPNDADSPRKNAAPNERKRAPEPTLSPALLSTKQRLALLTEFRDGLLEIAETMRGAPGIMRRMPPLPVALNGALASALLPPPKPSLLSGSSALTRIGDRRDQSPMTFVPSGPTGALEPERHASPNEPNAAAPRAPSRARKTAAMKTKTSPAGKKTRREKGEKKTGTDGKRRGREAPKKGAGTGAAATPRAEAGGRGPKK